MVQEALKTKIGHNIDYSLSSFTSRSTRPQQFDEPMNVLGSDIKPEMTLKVTIKLRKVFSRAKPDPTGRKGCVRCKMFVKKVKSRQPDAAMSVEEFYCDVGMKAVLRNIRRYLLKMMSLPLGSVQKFHQSILQQECIE